MRRLVIIMAVAVAVVACGGKIVTGQIKPTGPKFKRLDKVNPKAQTEFERALRALRVGGDNAYDNAKAKFNAALAIDPKIWEAHHDLGVIAHKEGEDEAAIAAYTKALEINKGHMPTLMARAESHRRAGHKKDARADYEAALRSTEEEDPNRRDAAARLASLLRENGDYDDAVTVLRDTVRLSGSSSKIYTELGLIYTQQKRHELAQLVLQKAIELDAKDPGIYNALAILALRLGKAQEAFQLFDQAVSLDASFIDARFNKASVLLDAGDYKRAKDELTAIVNKRDDDYAAQVALGVAHRGLKEHAEAKKIWDRVVKEAPRRSSARFDAMFDIALLKADFLNDPAGAKADLDRYLQEAPGSHEKRKAAEEKRKDLGK